MDMVMLLIIGLAGLGLAGLYLLESSATMVAFWGILGIVCICAYLVNLICTKTAK